MEEFSAYIKNVVVFTILMVFADMLMPNRFSKKYVSFILGIVLAVTAASPLIRIFDKGFDADFIMSSVQQEMLTDTEEEYSDLLFEKIFEENLLSDIRTELEKEGIEFEEISSVIREDADGKYCIEEISVSADDENFEIAKKLIEEKYAPEKTVRN